MAWRDDLREASFRRVPFQVVESTLKGGKNIDDNEASFKSVAGGSGVSIKKREFSVEAYVLGADYLKLKEKLIAALESSGKGILIHPFFGNVNCECKDYTVKEDAIKNGGQAWFSIVFIRSPIGKYPKFKEDPAVKLKLAGLKARDLSVDDFEQNFSVADKAQFVKDNATGTLQKLMDKFDDSVKKIRNVNQGIADATYKIRTIKAAAKDIIETPLKLANEIRANLDLIKNLSLNPKDLFAAYKNNDSFLGGLETIARTTTSTEAMGENQDAFVVLFQVLNLSYKAETAAEIAESEDSFDTAAEAVQTRDDLISEIDGIMENLLNDELFLALVDLKTQIQRSIPSSAQSLPNLSEYELQETTNSIVLSYDLYNSLDRENEIIKRNKIDNPGFIFGGRKIEVIVE